MIDTHGLSLKEAKELIIIEIERAYKQNQDRVEVIHGYNNGDKIKNYLKNTKNLSPLVKQIVPDFINSGKTLIYINKKIK